MDELKRRALLGDWEAQQECTRREIVLPCPSCGGESRLEDMGWPHHVYCTECGMRSASAKWGEDGEKEAIKKWNTRPAPPVGRCRDCIFYTVLGHCQLHSQVADECGPGAAVEMLPDNFCSYFTLKEA